MGKNSFPNSQGEFGKEFLVDIVVIGGVTESKQPISIH